MVYTEKIHPVTGQVIRSVGMFIDYFTNLESEDCHNCLEDMISGLRRAERYCDILKHLHKIIFADLNKNGDKAVVGMLMLNKMRHAYKQEAEQLRREASTHRNQKEYRNKAETYVHICTLGI